MVYQNWTYSLIPIVGTLVAMKRKVLAALAILLLHPGCEAPDGLVDPLDPPGKADVVGEADPDDASSSITSVDHPDTVDVGGVEPRVVW